jgi:hypothetical protein
MLQYPHITLCGTPPGTPIRWNALLVNENQERDDVMTADPFFHL